MFGSSKSFRHEIQLYHDLAKDVKWRWFVHTSNIHDYSRKLGSHILNDRLGVSQSSRSRIVPGGGVTESALRLIISTIPGDSEDKTPELAIDNRDQGFTQLLELAIACWEYECPINEQFLEFARVVQKKWTACNTAEFSKGAARLERKKPIDWMFIALVFNWHDIFQSMSVRVIIKYDPKGFPVEDNVNLPSDFRDLVDQTRRQKVTNTYNCIRDAWISLYNPEGIHAVSMGKIHEHFQDPRLGIDLRCPTPEDLHEHIDADGLLHEFGSVLGRQEGKAIEPPLFGIDVTSPPTRTRGRGGGFSAIARMTIQSGYEKSKKLARNNAPLRSTSSSPGSDSGDSWKQAQSSLESIVKHWRTCNLAGIPFSEFFDLRSRHIQQATSELSPLGRYQK
ncbi:hypothetical protein ONS95_008912 [Cadophora gregata]|uniref:uncharacterized protein n=1 Tax=Cadophora gregata TaxID=51156 RepID=UPI0026DB6349|nr:uncharacterized protein ONS95_008912 [Cadophora gregata]KAK0123922.1 hypothetical protein ONS95_008912 [Cadophora gregata]KAK0130261.1 hypothetical protein ONS96_000784 [Cadophora gregata f. sp. sojae]